jgi:DNA-binding PadR family transcriptional regulator
MNHHSDNHHTETTEQPGDPGRRGRRGGPGGGAARGFGPGGRGGPRGGGPRGGGPRGGRRRRGAIRAAILTQLAAGPSNGYGLIRSISERTDGAWTPSPGSIYPTLQQLVDEGLIEPTVPGPGADFRLTEAGAALVADEAESLDQVWSGMATEEQPGVAELMGSAQALWGAVSQVRGVGTPEQMASARGEVDRARRAIYRILSEEPSNGTERQS